MLIFKASIHMIMWLLLSAAQSTPNVPPDNMEIKQLTFLPPVQSLDPECREDWRGSNMSLNKTIKCVNMNVWRVEVGGLRMINN